MAKLDIITIPDPLLRETSAPVDDITEDMQQLMDDMLETMYGARGIGLAAIQVAIPRRLIVVDVARDDEPKAPVFMINPEIVEMAENLRPYEEGCLSIPEYYAEIERPDTCTVRYIDREGKRQEQLCAGTLSTVVQHEIDHLNGKLFIDYISKLRRDRVVKKFIKDKKRAAALA